MGFIYKVTNILTKKSYIGQTIRNIDIRKKEHIERAKHGSDHYLHRSLIKYGTDFFTWDIIEECDNDILNEREMYYISYYNTGNGLGYNMTIGGDSNYGSSGENHWLKRKSKEEYIEWIKKHRIGDNNPNYGNGESISGKNHYTQKLSKEKLEIILNKISGENNYQSKMSQEELKEKCWINKLTLEEKEKWINDNLRGDNNASKKAHNKNPEKYRGINNHNFGIKGKYNKTSKKYIITLPDGVEYLTISIAEFCRSFKKEKLNAPGFHRCAKGHIETYRGYKCRYYSEKDINIPLWEST